MNRIIPVFLFIIILVGSLTACNAAENSTSPPKTTAATTVKSDDLQLANILNGKVVAGVYRVQNEADIKNRFSQVYKKYIPDFTIKEFVFYDNIADGLLMLNSGKVDALETMSYISRYLAQRNSNLTVLKDDKWKSTIHMLFSQNNNAQYDKVNSVLKAMKEDGTVDKLIDKWITNLPAGEEPAGGEMAPIAGAETIKVGVSGDAPPLDYFASNGTPGGFNVAILNEIGKRAQVNIELISVTSSGRFAALQSGKIDAFLWHNANAEIITPTVITTRSISIGNQTYLLSDSYYQDYSSYVFKK
jgi:ABC-type amino acid transport substrate-binding protein